MVNIDNHIEVDDFRDFLLEFWKISGNKIKMIEKRYSSTKGSPVFTKNGKFTSQGWTEWTQGFQYGSAILQYDATSDSSFLKIGRENTVQKMASHITHFGVHDHGFNNLSTYGNLLRLMNEGKTSQDEWERNFYELAIKVSGAVQANRWTPTEEGGFIYSFNGPHSLFVDTIRSCRILLCSHFLGHRLLEENDVEVNLLERALQHILTTAQYSIFYGENRDKYDEWGRTAHESIFNVKNGNFRCYNSQQGYTGFSTWTRGLGWAICGFSEQLEALSKIPEKEFPSGYEKEKILGKIEKAAKATCDFYIKNTPTDGIPYWDTGAPGLSQLGDYKNKPADPYNNYEPVDSSAAAISAQGFLRLGKYLMTNGFSIEGNKYYQAGLSISKTLFQSPYLNKEEDHEGLLLHSIYHWPNEWDSIPGNSKIAHGNSSMWGDYHLRELALMLQREINKDMYYTFFTGLI